MRKTQQLENNLIPLSGGGKSGSSRTPIEEQNTLQSNATIRIVEVLSEGEIKGIAGGLKGTYFGDTVVQNKDGSYNFNDVLFETREGTDDQEYMPGFPGVETSQAVNVEVKLGDTHTRTVSAEADAARLSLRLPQGLRQIDKKTGDIRGWRLTYAVYYGPAGSTPSTMVPGFPRTINGKTNSPYELAVRVERPPGVTGAWAISVRRINRESEQNDITDRLDWFALTELQDIQIAYEDAAIVGMAINAESTGSQVPVRSYVTDGIIMQVPTNYNPTILGEDHEILSPPFYSNTPWDGTFKWAWCDDPVWVVYDLLTNTRYGLGEKIDPNWIDIESFITASRYNCQMVPDYEGGYVPRYRFNYQFQERTDAWTLIENTAATCMGSVAISPGAIKFIQDRQQASVATINNSHVVNGEFNYSSTDLNSHITAADVTFYDYKDNFNPRTITEQAESHYINRYGFNKAEISALGVIDEAQARRMAKWIYYSTLVATERVSFQISVGGRTSFSFGDVIEIADNDYINAMVSGSVNSASLISSNSFDLELDRMLWMVGTNQPIQNGQLLKIQLLDGRELSGTISLTTTKIDDALGQVGSVECRWTMNQTPSPAVTVEDLVNAPFIVVTNVVPRPFRVVEVASETVGVWDITAVQYDPNKYSYIEDGIIIDPPVFNIDDSWSLGQVENIVATPETYINDQGIISLRLRLDWDEVDGATKYRVRYRRENNQYEWTENLQHNEYRIDPALPGIYEYFIYAYNNRGVQSPAASGYYVLQAVSGNPSPLAQPTNLQLQGGITNTQFADTTFTITWNAPAESINAFLKDYRIELRDGAGDPVHTFHTSDNSHTFTREDIVRWYGTAVRSIPIAVYARDTLNRVSVPISATFTNPAPALPTGISIHGGLTEYWIEYTKPTDIDLAGVYVWHTSTPPLTVNASSLVADESATPNQVVVSAEMGTTYTVRFAFYDNWSREGLNITNALNVTTNSDVIGIVLDAPTLTVASNTISTSNTGVETAEITLQWANVDHAMDYTLEIDQRSPVGPVTFPSVGRSNGANTTYSFTALPGVQYRARIRATASTSASPWSSYVTFTAAADSIAPTAPTGLQVIPYFTGIAIRWTNPAQATDDDLVGIQIWRRVGSSGSGSLVYTINTSPRVPLTSWVDTNLTPGTMYSYRIRGVDRSGNLGTYTSWSGQAEVGGELPAGTELGPGVEIVSGVIFENGVIQAQALGANSVIAGKIAANAVNTRELHADAVTASKIKANSIEADHIGAKTVITEETNIGSAVINSAAIQNAAITNAKIAGAIQSNNYVPGLTGWKIDKGATGTGAGAMFELNGSSGSGSTVMNGSTIEIYSGTGAARELRIKIGIS